MTIKEIMTYLKDDCKLTFDEALEKEVGILVDGKIKDISELKYVIKKRNIEKIILIIPDQLS